MHRVLSFSKMHSLWTIFFFVWNWMSISDIFFVRGSILFFSVVLSSCVCSQGIWGHLQTPKGYPSAQNVHFCVSWILRICASGPHVRIWLYELHDQNALREVLETGNWFDARQLHSLLHFLKKSLCWFLELHGSLCVENIRNIPPWHPHRPLEPAHPKRKWIMTKEESAKDRFSHQRFLR